MAVAFDPPHPKPAELAPVEQGAPDPRVTRSGTYLVDERRERRAVHHRETLPTWLHAEYPADQGPNTGLTFRTFDALPDADHRRQQTSSTLDLPEAFETGRSPVRTACVAFRRIITREIDT